MGRAASGVRGLGFVELCCCLFVFLRQGRHLCLIGVHSRVCLGRRHIRLPLVPSCLDKGVLFLSRVVVRTR